MFAAYGEIRMTTVKVYGVASGLTTYEYSINEIFSTREKAEEYREKIARYYARMNGFDDYASFLEDYGIEEFDVDPALPDPDNPMWCVWIREDEKLQAVVMDIYNSDPDISFLHSLYRITVRASNESEALEKAMEWMKEARDGK